MRSRRVIPFGRETGTAMVEFALVLPVLLLILIGIMDFGKAFNYWDDGQQLANEGARLAAVGYKPTSGTLAQYILQRASTKELKLGSSEGTGPAQVCVSFPDGQLVGNRAVVTVDTPYQFLPYLGNEVAAFKNRTFRLQSQATMRVETVTSGIAGCSS